MDKQERYREICKRTRRQIGGGMTDCPECGEVNLWTYWQGYGAGLSPDILLVGQDWGSLEGFDSERVLANVRAMEGGGGALDGAQYLDGFSPSELCCTDRNLIALFSELGFDIAARRHAELFFTNLVPGYRVGNSSGGSVKGLITPDVLSGFRDLVELLEPRAVLCLGRETAAGVLRSLGQRLPKGSYLDAVVSGPIAARHGSGETAVFPLYHCGFYGVMNRNRAAGAPARADDLELQRQDWARVRRYLDAL